MLSQIPSIQIKIKGPLLLSPDAQVCRQIHLGVPPNRKYLTKYAENVIISIILVLLLHFGVPPNFCIKLVCRELKKVDNHWSKVSAKMTKVLYHFKIFYMDSGVQEYLM